MVRARRMGGGGGGGGGSGTVTSVALAMPAIFSVSGSPITTAGTITVTLANETANTVFAGPTSGGAATPTFRALVAADYPVMVGDSGAGGVRGAVPAPAAGDATKFLRGDGTWVAVSGTGTVTSVALTAPAEISVTGSPVTTSGTLALAWANQNANIVFAGPTSGGAATPSFRALVANDYPTMVGDSGAGGTKGAVPAPAAGDAAAGKFLKADGTWSVPSGGGGANTALSNLAAVAVNTALVFSGQSQLTSGVANSGTNVGHILESANTLSGTTKLFSVRNNTTEKAFIYNNGDAGFAPYSGGSIHVGPLSGNVGTGRIQVGDGVTQIVLGRIAGPSDDYIRLEAQSGYLRYGGVNVPSGVSFGGFAIQAGSLFCLDNFYGDSGYTKSADTGGNMSSKYDGTEITRYDGTDYRFLRATQPGAYQLIGDASAAYRFGGIVKINVTSVGNVGTGEDDLITYALPASYLGGNNQSLIVEAWGTFASNPNAKRVRLYFGATAVFDTTAQNFTGGSWSIRARIVRTGSTTQISAAWFDGDTSLVVTTAQTAAPAETLTNSVTIKGTGEATSTDDIVQLGLIVRYEPASN